jgi:hypothetical protein
MAALFRGGSPVAHPSPRATATNATLRPSHPFKRTLIIKSMFSCVGPFDQALFVIERLSFHPKKMASPPVKEIIAPCCPAWLSSMSSD